jgi:hypothetical protein
MSEALIKQGPPMAASSNQPPPPEKPVSNVLAWIMVAAPLLGVPVDVGMMQVFGIQPNVYLVNIVYVLVNMAIAITDANWIEASGRNVRGIRLLVWAILFPPVYFIQRARALGESYVIFFAWLGAVVTSIALNVTFGLGIYWVTGLPGCHASFTAARAKAVFDSLRNSLGAPLGVRALDVGNVVEKTATDKLVSCEATIRGDNGKTYYVIIVHQWQDWDIYTKVGIYAVQ